MTTQKQIIKKLNSLDYGLKLFENLPKLEKEIIDLCKRYETNVLGGYKIEIQNGHVYLQKLPKPNVDELQFSLGYDKMKGALKD